MDYIQFISTYRTISRTIYTVNTHCIVDKQFALIYRRYCWYRKKKETSSDNIYKTFIRDNSFYFYIHKRFLGKRIFWIERFYYPSSRRVYMWLFLSFYIYIYTHTKRLPLYFPPSSNRVFNTFPFPNYLSRRTHFPLRVAISWTISRLYESPVVRPMLIMTPLTVYYNIIIIVRYDFHLYKYVNKVSRTFYVWTIYNIRVLNAFLHVSRTV